MGKNELPEDFNIYYYPTVRYYPKDARSKPIDYDQGLELNDLIRFVKRVATVQLVEDYSVLTPEESQPQKDQEIKTQKEEEIKITAENGLRSEEL